MMVAFFIRGFVLATATLCVVAFGASPAVADTTVQNVTLSCSDGTNIGLTLTADEVTSLVDAVTTMSLYPAGLACAVDPQTDPPSGGNPHYDYAVGGGDQFPFLRPCAINYGFSAHTLSDTPLKAQGTFNETVPGGCAGLGMTGELRVSITCLTVIGGHADMSGQVTKATDFFFNTGYRSGQYALISTTDNHGIDPLVNDTLGVSPSPTKADCAPTAEEPQILNGSINVHDADGF